MTMRITLTEQRLSPQHAEPAYRRKGLAITALQLMLSYATSPSASGDTDGHSPLPVPREKLVVRIGDKNEPSIRLFKKLGFVVTKHVEVFEEIEMRYQSPSNSDSKSNEEGGVGGHSTEGTVLRWRAGEIKRVA